MTAQSTGPADRTGEGPAASGPKPRLSSDVIAALAILAFCAAVFAVTTTFEEVSPALSQGVSPEAFPRLVIGLMALLSLLLIWQARGRAAPAAHKAVPPIAYDTVLAIAAFMAVLNLIGPFVAMVLMCVGLPVLWGERRWAILIVYAFALPAGIYLLFHEVLEVQFPRGLLYYLLN